MTPAVRKNAGSMSRRLRAALAVTLMFSAFAAGTARAEKADREKPINIEADRVTVDDAKQIATFIGRVVLTQGTLVIRGDRMEVRQDDQGFKHGTTWGALAYFKQKRDGYDEYIEGWAERIEYDSRADKMEMFNRALMKKGSDEVRGHYISYNANTEFFQVTGGGTKAAAGSDGRVHAVIQPKPKDKPAAITPAPSKPAGAAATSQPAPL